MTKVDTDKYEGHTEDIERWQMMARSLPAWANEKDEQLVRDAVYLLEEVKRLRSELNKIEVKTRKCTYCYKTFPKKDFYDHQCITISEDEEQ